ncbi:peptidoglycan editing factor PgeF [Simiduia agarivorans]|uniref:Purine nucleoside phosphorylase n=1 Tax=Simiduia agarivorans (strain DSM 21679 / JCM 13881 / BCRC 17597 / SA1) TaxID=1117647 RepID=K4KRC1_SIMAS|nr:peptidoglycan editing factor PgeF [Simiduia agarivorans]AFV00669.1 YfiH [Simiduia agarivorans SA1 = DSM 21679]
MSEPIALLSPDWPAPARVKAVVTERSTGASAPPYAHANLALHVGDDEQQVLQNRQQLLHQLDLPQVQWLEQVHGTEVVIAQPDNLTRTADACITQQAGLACAVLTADCVPVLLCNAAGTQVAAVHAGWRGLSAGILANAVAMFDAAPDQLMAWIGPAIGPTAFEVGVDVLEACFDLATDADSTEHIAACFTPGARPLKFYADLFALTRIALTSLGIAQVYGGTHCTATENHRFYSYRKEGTTGRFASLIWLS